MLPDEAFHTARLAMRRRGQYFLAFPFGRLRVAVLRAGSVVGDLRRLSDGLCNLHERSDATGRGRGILVEVAGGRGCHAQGRVSSRI
jgi:hypothetical protein